MIKNKTLYLITNELFKVEVEKILDKYKAFNYFNFIDLNLINIATQECMNLGIDKSLWTPHYN